MSKNVDAFDAWIRSTFVELNTALEELYFGTNARSAFAVGQAVTAAQEVIAHFEDGSTAHGDLLIGCSNSA